MRILMQLSNGRHHRGMTLGEVMAALLIASMILVAVLEIYGRVQATATSIHEKLDPSELSGEILQRLTEDLDKVISTGTAVQISLESKPVGGFELVRLTIRRLVQDRENKEVMVEEIVWQTAVDSLTDRLILYRAHTGDIVEDRVLEKGDDGRSLYPYVPLCTGLTVFRLQVPQGEALYLNTWEKKTLPAGLVATLSFAEPQESIQGDIRVNEEDEIRRTIAIDRTRKNKFRLAQNDDSNDLNTTEMSAPDVNEPSPASGLGQRSNVRR